MVWIKGIYKIPRTKQMIFIVSDSSTPNNSPKPLSKSIRGTLDLERSDLNQSRKTPRKDLQWTLKIVRESDFLDLLESQKMLHLELTNQPSHSSENMELLAINLLETPESCSEHLSSNTPKHLCNVPNEDIIEVFI